MYTTADIARRLGCTPQAVSKYRRRLESERGDAVGRPDPTDGRRTLFTEAEVEAISAMAPRVPVTESLEAELVDGEDFTTAAPITASLALRHGTLPPAARAVFDLTLARAETAAISQHSAATAARGDNLLSAYATARMGQAISNIERTISTLEANALGDAVGMLGESTAPQSQGGGRAA